MITDCRTECRRILVRLNPHWGKSGTITTRSGIQFVPWLKVALEQEFVHNNPVRVNDDNFNNDIAGTRRSYQAGISAALTEHTHIYVSINYEKGDGMESPWTGYLGSSYRF